MTNEKLIQLEQEKKDTETEIELLAAEEKLVPRKLAKARSNLGSLNGQIKRAKVKPKGDIVSDHALIRYIERIAKTDIEALKEIVCPQNVRAQIEVLGNGEFPVEIDGVISHWLYVRGGIVTTVTIQNQREHKKGHIEYLIKEKQK